MKSKWLLYTESPHYHGGRYVMKLEEIEYINGEWHRYWYMYSHHNEPTQVINDISKPPGGYILSIIFNNYDSAVSYKKYIENKYYNIIDKFLDEVEESNKKFEKEFRFGIEKGLRKLKLEKIEEQFKKLEA